MHTSTRVITKIKSNVKFKTNLQEPGVLGPIWTHTHTFAFIAIETKDKNQKETDFA